MSPVSSPWLRLPVLPQVLLSLQQKPQTQDDAWPQMRLVELDVALSARVLALRNTRSVAESSSGLFDGCVAVLGEARIDGLIDQVAITQFFSPFNQLSDARWFDLWARINLRREFAVALGACLGHRELDELRWGTLLLGLMELRALAATEDAQFALPDGQAVPFSTQIDALALLLGVPKRVVDALHFLDEPLAQIGSAHPLIRLLRGALEAYPVAIDAALPTQRAGLAEVAASVGLLPEQLKQARQRAVELVSAAGHRLVLPGECLSSPWDALDSSDWPLSFPFSFHGADDTVALKLASTLRDQMLVKDVTLPWTWQVDTDLDLLLTGVAQDLWLLSGVERFMLYLYADAQLKLLHPPARCDSTLFSEISLGMEHDGSLVSHALASGMAVGSWQAAAPLTLLDRQLIRELSSTALFLLPLMQGSTARALLVIGVDDDARSGLESRAPVLNHYARLLWRRLAAVQGQQEQALRQRRALSEEASLLLRELRHELGSPLSIARNYLSIIALRFQQSGLTQSDLLPIEAEIDRVAELVDSFSRRVEGQAAESWQSVDLNRLTCELVRSLQEASSCGQSIHYRLDLDVDNPQIRANPLLLRQVLTNLLDNAAEASQAQGEITITTHGQVFIDGRRYVELTIQDQGPGMADEVLSNLFRPISTHKAPPHQGLGLSIVKQLMDQLEGVIELRSSRRGTLWSLKFLSVT